MNIIKIKAIFAEIVLKIGTTPEALIAHEGNSIVTQNYFFFRPCLICA
jgi:hypothetical protein